LNTPSPEKVSHCATVCINIFWKKIAGVLGDRARVWRFSTNISRYFENGKDIAVVTKEDE